MSSSSQLRYVPGHNWSDPTHYLHCRRCQNERYRQSRQAEKVATATALKNAIGAKRIQDAESRTRGRVICISPRLRNPRIRGIIREHGEVRTIETRPGARRVTIQIPHHMSVVRPGQATPLRTLISRHTTQKRLFSSIDKSELAQYFVPEKVVPQAGDGFWEALRAQIHPKPTDNPAPIVDEDEFPMPGSWPSWADEASPRVEPVRDDQASFTPGIFTLLGGLSASFFGAVGAGLWRPIQQILPGQPRQGQPEQAAESSDAVNRITQATDAHGVHSPKRPRLDEKQDDRVFPYGRPALTQPNRSFPLNSSQNYASQGRQRHGIGTNGPPFFRSGAHARPAFNAARVSNTPGPRRFSHRHRLNPNFNHAGHFSADAAYVSDSEDDEGSGSPMAIDSPEPKIEYGIESIFEEHDVTMGHAQPKLDFGMYRPTTLIQAETISAQPANHSNADMNPKLDAVTTAARRAVKLFPKDSGVSRTRLRPFIDRNASLEAPHPDGSLSGVPGAESLHHEIAKISPYRDGSTPRKAEKARYDDVLEFFPNDVSHSLPGLGVESLPADADKMERLKRELRERIRREEVESQNAILRELGVRRAKSTLISEPHAEWVKRASRAPTNGVFDPRSVHADAVELKPRDFAKLVPPEAWLNDDCVQSTLCCLAAYINKKACITPKVDAPKCVAISSLYWKAFCDDNKKLYPRPFNRKWNMNADNFFNTDTILIPVNSNSHWTLIVIRPSRRTVSYLDSFHYRNEAQIRLAFKWLEGFLGPKFVADDWSTQEFGAPRQRNAWDCGMFVITNAMCLALGISPMCYSEQDMPIQRIRIAAMLLNGGFHGDFDLGHL